MAEEDVEALIPSGQASAQATAVTSPSTSFAGPGHDPDVGSSKGRKSPSQEPSKGPDGAQTLTEDLQDLLRGRVTRIKEGDNVLLRTPSDVIKAVVVSREGLVHLGKFGAFPASELLNLHYDITYEIVPGPPSTNGAGNAERTEGAETDRGHGELDDAAAAESTFGQKKGKRRKKGRGKDASGGNEGAVGFKTNPGWNKVLRPFKSMPLVDAIIDDIQETNEFIDDSEEIRGALLTQEEIENLRAQGVSAEEMMQKQIDRHERFDLKTDFSKEKWRKRKEKKFSQTVHPLAPSIPNITSHYLSRSPQAILHLRFDTLSQLLSLANVRPGGRYMIVDDAGGLVTAAVLERMGCEGRILTFTDADSPPAWGVMNAMNFGEKELECVKWLNWLEAEEVYERPDLPDEDLLPAISAQKTQARLRKHNLQIAELNATRNELHLGHWDGLIIATELSPVSVLARLTPYLSGSGTAVIYSPFLQLLVETLAYAKKDPRYIAETLTESWHRTYQVLPGRTHPLMTTSATGGYLFHALRVLPHKFDFEPRHGKKRRKGNKPNGTGQKVDGIPKREREVVDDPESMSDSDDGDDHQEAINAAI